MATTNPAPKAHEPLFGPNVGPLASGPTWAVTNEKKVVSDDLTPDVVKAWIEKSKQPAQPTTTLQALVNLKRPTLRLLPLSAEDGGHPGDSDEQHLQQHGLEFEYDCDAPKCGIYVHVLLPKDHPDAGTTVSSSEYARLLVYENVTEGGFGRVLTLEDGAMLELGRFEHGSKPPMPAPASMGATGRLEAVGSSSEITEIVSPPYPPSSPEIGEVGRSRRKFAPFHFRKRAPQSRSVAGPALAVMDMGQEDAAGNEQDGVGQATGGAGAGAGAGAGTAAAGRVTVAADEGAGRIGEGKPKKDKDEGKGVKVMIRLAALDEMGTELMSPNEQVTYLHIVRFGAKDAGVEEASVEDTRPWVVKVVKREATIGPHTFQLHEIYGLMSSSTSAQASAPTAALPKKEHSYPPSTPLPDAPTLTPSGIVSGGEEEPQSECLLCLSAPREVVLLPCRHLVACRECALNMVEFGAGGQITQPSEDTAATTGTEGGGGEGGGGTGTGGGGTAGGGGSVNATTTATTTRRRRKAKGWYCPVCRQPYTSLLRISMHNDGHDDHEDDGHSHSITNGVQEMDLADGRVDENV